MYTKEEDKLFQRAIVFAGLSMKSCHNEKPVLIHSLRVAFYLYQLQYDITVIIASVLHDLIEDTSVTKEDILNEFGSEIADIVSLLTMDFKNTDYRAQYIENFSKIENNQKAQIIRCADIMDNASYIKLASPEIQKKVKEKHLYFYTTYKYKLKKERLWSDFERIIQEEL